MKLILLCLLSTVVLLSCNNNSEQSYAPKPKGYNRIALPPHAYQTLSETHPYYFEYSKSAIILPDTFADAEPHWIFIYYPKLKANIQLTYKNVGHKEERLKDYIEDAYKLAGKHQIRASSIKEKITPFKSGHTATLFKLEGDVPSPYQFFTTDSTTHFLRGAIYFPTATRNDSLAPVIEYLHKDMEHLINTLKWQ